MVGHISLSSDSANTFLQGTMKGKEENNRQKKKWEDNIKEWKGVDVACSTSASENRTGRKGIVAKSSLACYRTVFFQSEAVLFTLPIS